MGALSISMQPQRQAGTEGRSIKSFIESVIEQKGAFKDVTEDSVRDEADDDRNLGQDEHLETVVNGQPDTETAELPKQDLVMQARQEMLKQVGQAHQESVMALDLISLLLSKPGPAAAPTSSASTISPYIQQTLPLGSLDAARAQTPADAEAAATRDLTNIGWRLQALQNTADSLLTSATRLEKEIGRETKYWDEILKVKADGWPISRSKIEWHSLAVHFGFTEASPQFRARGTAVLGRNQNGDISLRFGQGRMKPKVLRVRLLRAGTIVSGYSAPLPEKENTSSIESQIKAAQASIFDEELYGEIVREARDLSSFGVTNDEKGVLLSFRGDKQIAIDLPQQDTNQLAHDTSDDGIPQAISLVLRLLLARVHHQSLVKRHEVPQPLHEGHIDQAREPILRPLVEALMHSLHADQVERLLRSYSLVMKDAGLECSYTTQARSRDLGTLAKAEAGLSRYDLLSRFFSNLAKTTYSISICSEAALRLTVQTAAELPIYGTRYSLHRIHQQEEEHIRTCTAIHDLEMELSRVILTAVKQQIMASSAWSNAEIGPRFINRYDVALQRRDTLEVALTRHALTLTWQMLDGTRSLRTSTWKWPCSRGDLAHAAFMDVVEYPSRRSS